MTVAHPSKSFQEILTELRNDFHPPLHYFITNILFRVIEYNDFNGRLTSAIIGIFGVIAMYFWGLQIKDKRTGLLMMLLACVNYYQLYYSQEIRMYILLFLFTALSATFFLRMVTNAKPVNYIAYTLVTTLLLYTHYFGLFVFGAEILCFFHLIIKRLNPSIIKRGLIAGISVAILYLPWLPFILNSGSQEHWMRLPKAAYLFKYLYNSLGKDPVAFALYTTGVILFVRQFISLEKKVITTQLTSYLLILYGLFTIYIFTYFVSLVKPVLQARCTIAAIPFLIAAVVLGLDSLKDKFAKMSISAIVISATINVYFVKNYYFKVTKENYKAIALIVQKTNPNTVAISYYAKFYNYYFEQLNASKKIINPLGKTPDSVLTNIDKFVLLNAHNGSELMSNDKIKFPALENYISTHFYVDTVFRTKGTYEHAIVYKRRK